MVEQHGMCRDRDFTWELYSRCMGKCCLFSTAQVTIMMLVSCVLAAGNAYLRRNMTGILTHMMLVSCVVAAGNAYLRRNLMVRILFLIYLKCSIKCDK
jgi:hypothetical protein